MAAVFSMGAVFSMAGSSAWRARSIASVSRHVSTFVGATHAGPVRRRGSAHRGPTLPVVCGGALLRRPEHPTPLPIDSPIAYLLGYWRRGIPCGDRGPFATRPE